MNELEVEGLCLSFGGLRAVSDVSFSVPKAHVFAIIGPNGAGKTTVLNMVSRVYDPMAGRIILHGEDITRVPPHRMAELRVARTFQNLELCGALTVLENALIGTHIHRRARFWEEMLRLPKVARVEARNRSRAEASLDAFGLLPLRDVTVDSISYGFRKQLEVARALGVEPSLLLLDEPAAGLNATDSVVMAKRVRQLCDERGITVVMIEHDMRFVREVADSVLALNYGRVLARGTSDEVLRQPDVIAAYLGRDDDGD